MIPRGPLRSAKYLACVRQMDCTACESPPPNEPHHHGPRGTGQKTDDYRTIPLCLECHRKQHDGNYVIPIEDLNFYIVRTIMRVMREHGGIPKPEGA